MGVWYILSVGVFELSPPLTPSPCPVRNTCWAPPAGHGQQVLETPPESPHRREAGLRPPPPSPAGGSRSAMSADDGRSACLQYPHAWRRSGATSNSWAAGCAILARSAPSCRAAADRKSGV